MVAGSQRDEREWGMTAVDTEPVVETAGDDEFDHLVTDEGGNVSLCGLDVSGYEWAEPEDFLDPCPVCLEIFNLEEAFHS